MNIKIAFVGAPHSGKTSTLKALKSRLKPAARQEYNITFIDEVASHVLATSDFHPRKDQLLFQCILTSLQLLREERAIDNSKNNIIITDRSLADAYIYTENYAEYILEATKQEILERYDTIIFFDSYLTDSNVKDGNALRYENISEIMELEQKTSSVYSSHKNFNRIPSYELMSDKISHAARLLNEIIGTEIFDAS